MCKKKFNIFFFLVTWTLRLSLFLLELVWQQQLLFLPSFFFSIFGQMPEKRRSLCKGFQLRFALPKIELVLSFVLAPSLTENVEIWLGLPLFMGDCGRSRGLHGNLKADRIWNESPAAPQPTPRMTYRSVFTRA